MVQKLSVMYVVSKGRLARLISICVQSTFTKMLSSNTVECLGNTEVGDIKERLLKPTLFEQVVNTWGDLLIRHIQVNEGTGV